MAALGLDVPTGGAFDAFADAKAEGDDSAPGSVAKVHVRVQQRNGRKSLTTVQGVDPSYDKKKILKVRADERQENGRAARGARAGNAGRTDAGGAPAKGRPRKGEGERGGKLMNGPRAHDSPPNPKPNAAYGSSTTTFRFTPSTSST